MNNVLVRFMDMPPTVRGCCVRHFDDDEYFTILLNSRLSVDMQEKAYRHEIEHIMQNDFSCNLNADQIESIRND